MGIESWPAGAIEESCNLFSIIFNFFNWPNLLFKDPEVVMAPLPMFHRPMSLDNSRETSLSSGKGGGSGDSGNRPNLPPRGGGVTSSTNTLSRAGQNNTTKITKQLSLCRRLAIIRRSRLHRSGKNPRMLAGANCWYLLFDYSLNMFEIVEKSQKYQWA